MQELKVLWQHLLAGLGAEVAALSEEERSWLVPRLARIARLQEQLDLLFCQAGGGEVCRGCGGACCERGKNHLALANLLAFLLAGEAPPEPDFSRPCPFLGEKGCVLEAPRRPPGCVTFLCEAAEAALAPGALSTFYALERELRSLYADFNRRYAGSGPSGVFIRAERLGGRPFLARP